MGGFFGDNPADTVVGSTDATESTIAEDAVSQTDTAGGFYQGSPDQTTTDAYTADALASKNAASVSETNAATSAANAASSEANAATSATNAASSETSVSADASAASASAASALASKNAAETAKTNAETAETNAETAETNAASSATSAATSASTATTKASEASTSASNAATSETNAASSATSASGSATTATTKASEASTSASNASTSESNAASSATSASTSASTATTKASDAATSETNAATSATNAATSATNSASSATASSNSASSATTAQSAAEAARDAALAAFDSFDDRYLGQIASNPSTDNDGNALVAGTLYFNTTTDEMKVYDGSAWLNAYASLSGALLATSNLSDLNNAGTARTNLGLGTAATTDASAYATAAQADQTVSLTGAGTTTVSGTYPNFTITGAGTTYTAGSGLSLTGTEFANTAPDQTVALTGAGATSISGTYPNFTITSTNTTYSVGDGGLTEINFTSADNTKLDGIEAGATADQTAAEILTAIKTVDGSGSGLDADTVDGIQGGSFLRSDVSDVYNGRVLGFGTAGNGANTSGAFLTIEGNTDGSGEGTGRLFFREHNTTTAAADNYGMSLGYRGGSTSVTTALGNTWTGPASIGNGEWGMWGHNDNATGSLVMHGPRSGAYVDFSDAKIAGNQVWHAGNDGSGSGLDADTVDGYHAYESQILDTRDSGDVTPDGFGDKRVSYSFTDEIAGSTHTWDSVITVKGWSDNYRAWQITSNSSNDDIDQNLYFRSGKGATWGSLRTVWDSGNDGSGSGLDADTLDGVQASGFITTSTTQPSQIAIRNGSPTTLSKRHKCQLGNASLQLQHILCLAGRC